MRPLVLAAVVATVAGCPNRVYVQVTPIGPLRLPPRSGPVEVLLAHRWVTTPHEELALIEVVGNRHSVTRALIRRLTDRAGDLGADAVIAVKQQYKTRDDAIFADKSYPYGATVVSGVAVRWRPVVVPPGNAGDPVRARSCVIALETTRSPAQTPATRRAAWVAAASRAAGLDPRGVNQVVDLLGRAVIVYGPPASEWVYRCRQDCGRCAAVRDGLRRWRRTRHGRAVAGPREVQRCSLRAFPRAKTLPCVEQRRGSSPLARATR